MNSTLKRESCGKRPGRLPLSWKLVVQNDNASLFLIGLEHCHTAFVTPSWLVPGGSDLRGGGRFGFVWRGEWERRVVTSYGCPEFRPYWLCAETWSDADLIWRIKLSRLPRRREVPVRSLRGPCEVPVTSLWGPCEVPARSLWSPFEVPILWGPCEVPVKSLWSPCEVPVRSLRGPCDVNVITTIFRGSKLPISKQLIDCRLSIERVFS